MKRLVNNMHDPLVDIMPLCNGNTNFFDLRNILSEFNRAYGGVDPFYTNRLFLASPHGTGDGMNIGMTFWRGKTEMIQL